MRPLLKALKTRIEALRSVKKTSKDKTEVYLRGDIPFLQLEIRRDHMNLDLWLPEEGLVEARASGLARAHPFIEDAIKVRFARAEELTKVARWLEQSYRHAPKRNSEGADSEGTDNDAT